MSRAASSTAAAGAVAGELITDQQLADRMQLDLAALHTLRQRHRWPCVKLGRFAYRFTPEQVEAIITRHTIAAPKTPPQPPEPAEREGLAAAALLAGQTARSAARSRGRRT